MEAEEKTEELNPLDQSKNNRYDYFNICHHFVRKIKKLNELNQIRKIKNPGFS